MDLLSMLMVAFLFYSIIIQCKNPLFAFIEHFCSPYTTPLKSSLGNERFFFLLVSV